jgi:hypothetical protein
MTRRSARHRRESGASARRRASRHSGWLVSVAVLVWALGGCATIDRYTDARIESEVKARLVGETDANLTRLGVVSQQGVVRLSGIVVSADHRARAEELAAGVAGVRRVDNRLQVGAAPQ